MADAVDKAITGSSRERLRKHREELEAKGLRPVTRWVPDTRSAEFQAEYRRQALAWAEYLRTSPEAKEEVAYWESMASDQGWVRISSTLANVTCNNLKMAESEAGVNTGSAKDRVRRHREALRAQGLRPIQVWVPDTRRPGFQEEIDRQCEAINRSAGEREALDFIERAMDYSGWV